MAGREKRKRRRKSRAADQRATEAGSERSAGGEREKVETEAPRSKDDLARERLVPLREGERPRAVTVAAIVAALLALSNIAGLGAGIEVGGESPGVSAVLPPTALMLVAAIGMWYARYWAVLGFQTILAFLIVLMSVLLVRAENVLGVIVALAIIAASGSLFWFLVKSLARIQMPERRPPDG